MTDIKGRIRGEEQALALARAQLAQRSPTEVAWRAGVRYEDRGAGQGTFRVPWLGQTYLVSYPHGQVSREDGAVARQTPALLLLHYLIYAEGSPPAGRWVAFRELPDGLIYDAAFRARVEPALLGASAAREEAFHAAARAIGGSPLAFGDAAYAFAALPHLQLAVVLHRGDDELPPAVTVLFDAVAGRYLPAEDLAILGGMLVGALLKNAGGK